MFVEPLPENPKLIALTYQTLDQCWVSVTPVQVNDASHARFLAAIERTDLLEDPSYAKVDQARANYVVLDQALRGWIGAKPVGLVVQALAEAGIPGASVNGPREISADPHLMSRSLVEVLDNRGVPITMQGPIPRFTRQPNSVRWAGELLGASNREVFLGLLKMTSPEFDELTHAQII